VPVEFAGSTADRVVPPNQTIRVRRCRKAMVPLSVLISRFTDVTMMKLAEGNVLDVIVSDLKHVSSKVNVPVRPKLPSELALP
jgi:hypothetical protein